MSAASHVSASGRSPTGQPRGLRSVLDAGVDAMTPGSLVREALDQLVFPVAARETLVLLDDVESDSRDVSATVAMDPVLAARVIRVCNSPFFRRAMPIDNIQKAIGVIGRTRLRDLVLACGVMKGFEDKNFQSVEQAYYWRHCVGCGVIAITIARQYRRDLADSALTAGLLHDIGQLVMFLREPQRMVQALEIAADAGDLIDMSVAERQVFGFDHASVGAELAQSWALPGSLSAVMRWHHEPQRADEHRDLVALVHVANGLADLFEVESVNLADAPHIDAGCFERLGLDPARVPGVLGEARAQFDEMQGLLGLQGSMSMAVQPSGM